LGAAPLNMFAVSLGASHRLGTVPLAVAVGASGRDVVSGVTPALFARDQVFGGALEPPDTGGADAVVP
jgi:hypothetical protein